MIGTTVSHYRILERLGQGGMGVVYKAEDTRLRRLVALKFLAPDLTRDPDAKQRFVHEARAASALDHPNICNVHEIDETDDGRLFIAMALYEGETLKERLERGRLSGPEASRLAEQLAAGLARAHGEGVVHRDLKPANIILCRDDTVKIVDFGLAKLANQTRVTRTGTTLGTVAYMSPEQARGSDVDARTDIWSLGVVLYEAVTGRLPFPGENGQAVIHSILTAEPQAIQPGEDGVPEHLAEVIHRCLQKDPDRRYPDARQVLLDLGGSQSAVETMALGDGWARRRTRWRSAGRLLAAAILLAAIPAAWFLWRTQGPGASQGRGASHPDPSWILVADFETTPPDSELALAARELITSSLAQSDVVTPLTREQVHTALENAGKPPGSRVRGALAQELAYRVSSPVYVEGRVDRVLNGYSIVLDLKNSKDRTLVRSVHGIAQDQEALISTLDGLGKDLRRTLGENEALVQSTRPLLEVMTPSFPAYKLYLEAEEEHQQGFYEPAIRLAREALTLDPDFAKAWTVIAVCKANLGDLKGTAAAMDSAMRFPERLTEYDRLKLQADRNLMIDWDLEAARRDYERIVERYPKRDSGNNLGVVLSFLGEREQALAAYGRVELGSPLRMPIIDHNYFNSLMGNHRLGEAREMLPRFTGKHWTETRVRLELALAEGDWGEVDHQARALQEESGLDPFNRTLARVALAVLDAQRGRARDALVSLGALEAEGGDRLRLLLIREVGQATCIAQGAVPEFSPHLLETNATPSALVWRFIWAAEDGRLDDADSLLAVVEGLETPHQKQFRSGVLYGQAWMHAHRGEWPEASKCLDFRVSTNPPGILMPHEWLRCLAREQLGDLDAAVQGLESIASGGICWTWRDWLVRPLYRPYALRKLVLHYRRLGREADAQRCLEALRTTMTDPDPDIRPLFEEAGLPAG